MYRASMGDLYSANGITCTDDALRIAGYYFPWGTKVIAYSKVRGVQRVDMGAFTGRARIWGTANPRYWANLDRNRMRKSVGLVLDLGARVKPVITPDDCDAVEQIIRKRAGLGPGDGSVRGPVI